MELRELKAMFGLSGGVKARGVYNHIIRECMPGGKQILEICERLHEAQHGRTTPDPMLQDLLNKAILAREKMGDAIQNHDEDGVIVRLTDRVEYSGGR